MSNWEIKKLREVLTIERGGSPRPIEKYITDSDDGINWIKISDATASDKYIYETKQKITKEGLHKTRVVNEGDFILSNSMSFGRPYIMKTTGCIHDGWLVLKQNGKKIFDTEFLYYLLSSPYVFQQFNFLAAGSTVRNLNISLVSSVSVPLPPLPEQQRIVEILDEVFEAITQAKSNAEQNLQNAKELFESYLQGVFDPSTRSGQEGEYWEERRFDEICVLQRGFDLPTHSRNNGRFPLVSSNGITDRIDLWKVKAPGVVTGRSGTIGNVHFIEEDFWPLNTALYIKNFHGNYERCIYYFLSQFDLGKYSSGAGVPTLNRNNVHGEKVWFPKSIETQQTTVQKLDALSAETKKLEAIYQQKINDLEELKKSVLGKAFSGQLKSSKGAIYVS